MLRTLSLRTGLLSLLAIMTFLLLVVSGMGIYALSKSSSSLERISVLQGEKMARLNEGYTQILRARNESGQAVRMMEVVCLPTQAMRSKSLMAKSNREIKRWIASLKRAWMMSRAQRCWLRLRKATAHISIRASNRCRRR
jgi:phosphoglycerate-specific signal transduction histidine kinase